ncbi:MAG: phosphoribosylanthranilate isomerase [Candidatus Dormibacteria bacterium]
MTQGPAVQPPGQGAIDPAALIPAFGAGTRTRVKICGCTTPAEVAAAAAAGADAVGLIFAPSPRRVSLTQAVSAHRGAPPGLTVVGVFVNPAPAQVAAILARLPGLVLQFSGEEPPDFCVRFAATYIKAIAVTGDFTTTLGRHPQALALLETPSQQRGGSGRTFAWDTVAQLVRDRPALVGGGLDPDNVADCVRRLRPHGVDVRTGVESAGVRDQGKVRAFIEAVRSADALP